MQNLAFKLEDISSFHIFMNTHLNTHTTALCTALQCAFGKRLAQPRFQSPVFNNKPKGRVIKMVDIKTLKIPQHPSSVSTSHNMSHLAMYLISVSYHSQLRKAAQTTVQSEYVGWNPGPTEVNGKTSIDFSEARI